MLDLTKPESREILLEMKIPESLIEELVKKQKKGEKFTRIQFTDTMTGKKRIVRIPDSPEEIEEKKLLAKERRKKNRDSQNKLVKNAGFERHIDYRNHLAKQKGFEDYIDYRNDFIKKRGFKNYNDYRNKMRYEKGIHLPMSINEDCPLWLGICIAEEILPDIFENPIRMLHGNPGYDYICKNDYRIDVKSSCLYNDKYLNFHIRQNTIADYFLLIGFDNRTYLNLLNIWIIKGNELVNTKFNINKRLNDFVLFEVTNSTKGFRRHKKYELSADTIDKAKIVCKRIKENLRGNIDY